MLICIEILNYVNLCNKEVFIKERVKHLTEYKIELFQSRIEVNEIILYLNIIYHINVSFICLQFAMQSNAAGKQ